MSKSEAWIQTFTGKKFKPFATTKEMIDIHDIAHSLAMQCRFNGHCEQFYSIAEHSWHVSYLVPAQYALDGLLHDAAEAYVGDILKPIKNWFPEYEGMEDHIMYTIANKYGISHKMPDCVRDADVHMLNIEIDQIMKSPPASWRLPTMPHLRQVLTKMWKPKHAKEAFLSRFEELTGIKT